MIKKKYVKSRKCHQITFEIPKKELPKEFNIETVAIVGEFNSWDASSHLMKTDKKGTFKATIELDLAKNYQFRYLANETHWFNAWNPDAFIPNEMGGENCVLQLESIAGAAN